MSNRVFIQSIGWLRFMTEWVAWQLGKNYEMLHSRQWVNIKLSLWNIGMLQCLPNKYKWAFWIIFLGKTSNSVSHVHWGELGQKYVRCHYYYHCHDCWGRRWWRRWWQRRRRRWRRRCLALDGALLGSCDSLLMSNLKCFIAMVWIKIGKAKSFIVKHNLQLGCLFLGQRWGRRGSVLAYGLCVSRIDSQLILIFLDFLLTDFKLQFLQHLPWI